ncbi:hypothetical protein L7F22_064090 [Adiantum nelumboides]|nr:hypothetical protein [Adiantum nelumboides]
MAWSAVVRRDATPLAGPVTAPLPRLQLDSLKSCEESSNSISVAVIDANALISFDSSARLLALACCSSSSQSTRFVTVKEVLEEVRAPASQFHLDALPCSLDCIDPSEEALQKVIKFARATGDLASLSDVDLKVTHMRERDLPGWGSNVKNLEEWEQLPQEPDSKGEEGSHILGLSNLSLDTFEQGNTAPDEEQKRNTQTEESMTASEGKKVYVEKNTNRPVNEDECASAVREGEQDSMGQSLLVKDHHESSGGVIYDGENSEESLQNMEEQEIQAGGGWERAVSRSTRRKHEKRAARAALKNLSTTKQEVESVEGIHVCAMVSQTDGVNSDAICSCTGIDEDGEESMVDEIDYFQESEEACPSIFKTSGEKEAKAGSNQDSESEASWALRPLSQSKVACVTADFPMQNVLLQIGLRVISPNGLQIQQLQRWALKCEACRNVTSDVGRIFCPKCGNGGTLYKVSITIGPNGVVHTGTKKRFNIRGTKYSLPLPKGGRQGVSENPILREDQLPKKMLRSKKKATIPDLTSPAEAFVMKSGDAQRTKLDSKSKKCIFLGYSLESKGYKLYDSEAKKIIVSRNVVFCKQPHAVEDEGNFFINNKEATSQMQPPEIDSQIEDESASSEDKDKQGEPQGTKPFPKWIKYLLDGKTLQQHRNLQLSYTGQRIEEQKKVQTNYAFMMDVLKIEELKSFEEAQHDPQWKEAV